MSQDLDDLSPEFCSMVKIFLAELKTRNIGFMIEVTHRSKLEQARLYSMGRIQEAEHSYTRNRPGESFHNYGMAIDIYPVVNGHPKRNHPDLQKTMGEIGKKIGLVWGGDFNPPEPQHYQMPDMTLTKLKVQQG